MDDINGDGIPEHVYGNGFTANIVIASLNSRLKIRAISIITHPTYKNNWAHPSSAGDIDKDGTPDMFASTGTHGKLFVMFMNPDLTVRAWKTSSVTGGSYCGHSVSSAGDVDGNGVNDAVVYCNN